MTHKKYFHNRKNLMGYEETKIRNTPEQIPDLEFRTQIQTSILVQQAEGLRRFYHKYPNYEIKNSQK